MIFNTVRLNKELTATKKSLKSEIDARATIEKDLKEAQDTIGEFMATKKKLEAKIAELEKKNVVTNEVINKRVNTELANIGVTKGTVSENAPVESLSPENALAEYEKLQGAEQSAYYAKNSKLILTAISRQHNKKSMLEAEMVKNTIKI